MPTSRTTPADQQVALKARGVEPPRLQERQGNARSWRPWRPGGLIRLRHLLVCRSRFCGLALGAVTSAAAASGCSGCPEFEDPGHHTYTAGEFSLPGVVGEFDVTDGIVHVDGEVLTIEYTGPDGQRVIAEFALIVDSGLSADSADSDSR